MTLHVAPPRDLRCFLVEERGTRVKVEVNDRVNVYVAVKLKVGVDVKVMVEVHDPGTPAP